MKHITLDSCTTNLFTKFELWIGLVQDVWDTLISYIEFLFLFPLALFKPNIQGCAPHQ